MLLALSFPIGGWADAGEGTGTLYISSVHENHCLTPWMDIFEDPSGSLTLNDDIIAAYGKRPTRIHGETLNLGVGGDVFWLRFRVGLSPDAPGKPRQARILDLGAAYPDRIRWSLFDGRGNRMAAGGTRSDRDAFALVEVTPTPQTYHLMVQSTTALLMHPHLFTWGAYLDRNKQKMVWFGLFAGIILAVGVYNFYLYFQLRDTSYLWYVLHLVFVLLYFLGINGLTGTYLLPGRPDTIGMLDRSFLGLMTATIALMTRSFLMSRVQTPVVDRFIVGLVVLGCAISMANLFFQARLVVSLLILMGILVPTVMVLAALRAYRKGFKPARLFMLAWGFFVVGVVLFAMTNGGVLPFTVPGFYGFQISSAIAAILLSFSLGDRIQMLRRERDSFKKSMERVFTILHSIESGVFVIESETQVIREVNLAAEEIIGRPREEIIGKNCWQFIRSAEGGTCPVSDACRNHECNEDKLINTSGAEIPILRRAKLIELDGHHLILESFVDISDLKQAEEAVRRSEAKFRSLFESSRDAVIILDQHRFVDCNSAALAMFGYTSPTALLNRSPADHSPLYQPSGVASEKEARQHLETALSSGSHAFEWLHKRANGDLFPAEVMLSAVALEDRKVVQALVRDISERKSMEEDLKRLASTDPLTGANNRRSFLRKGNYELNRSKRYRHNLAFLMLDVDYFKTVNDTHGHQTGDMVLRELVSRCIQNLRSTDLFGRMGGEEFAVILPETHADNAVEVGEGLRRTLSHVTVESDNGPVRFTVSVGLSMFEADDDTLEKIMGRADSALYKAKQNGRNCLVRG